MSGRASRSRVARGAVRRPPRGAAHTTTVDLERYRGIVPEWGPFVEAASRPEPTVLRVRTGKMSERDLLGRLGEQGFHLRPIEGLPGFHQVEDGPFPASLTLEHWLGLFYVQQASTGVAAPALAPVPGERVLDMCAAPGGKTSHLAELMADRGCLVASEMSESRIRGLLGNVYRLGHPNVLAVAGDGRRFPEGALFDRVLVDAPCSGEGTLRCRAGKAPRQSRGFAGYVTGTQRALLERAIRLTRPGGTVLYVTCTFAPEENEAVVDAVLGRMPVEVEPLHLPVPHASGITAFAGARYHPSLEGAARIYPHHFDSGGLFLARLRRLDGHLRDDAGWSPVPSLFPGEGGSSREESWPPGDARATSGAGTIGTGGIERPLAGVRAELAERWGVEDAGLEDAEWIMRGGRLWLHTAREWPLESWAEGGWRAISLGLRAAELDARGRARPTNDFLRWADARVRAGILDVDRGGLERLLGREAVPVEAGDPEAERRGPVALRFQGAVIGRGALTARGLVSEIPKARAADLARVLAESRGG